MTRLQISTLRGTLLTHLARGEASVPLDILLKTARTYVRKGYLSPADLRAVLDEVEATGVEAFKEWASYSERQRRFQALKGALSTVFAGDQHSRAAG